MECRFVLTAAIRKAVLPIWAIALLPFSVLNASAKDWPQFGFDAANSRSSQEVIVGNLTPAWTYAAGAAITASPVAAAGRLFVADLAGQLHGLDLASGATIWKKRIGVAIESTPVLVQGRLVVATKEGTVVALDPSSGDSLWTADLQSTVVSSLGTDGQRIFVTTGFPSGRIHALNPSSGATLWSYAAGQVTFSSPAVAGGKVYFGANNGKFTAVDAATGTFLFAFSTGGGVYRSSPAAAQGYFFAVPGNVDRNLYRIDASSGLGLGTVDLNTPAGHSAPSRRPAPLEESPPDERDNPFQMDYAEKLRTGQWVESGPSRAPRRAPAAAASDSNFVSSPATDGARAFAVAGSGTQHLFGVGVATSAVLWAVDFGAPGSGGYSPTPAVFGTEVLAVTAAGGIRRLQSSDGSLLQQIDLGKSASASPAFSNGVAVVAASDGTVHGYRTDNTPPALPPASSRSPANLSGLAPTQKCAATRCRSVTLTWGDGSDSLTSASQLKYLIEVDDDADLESQDAGYALHTVAGTGSFTLPSPLNAGTTLYWRLRVEDAHGAQSQWSAVQSFSVLTLGVPSMVKDLAAVPGEEKITVSWSAGPGTAPTGYWIQVGDQKAQDIGPLAAYTFPLLTAGVTYTICVTPYNEDNEQGPKACASATPLARNVALPPPPAAGTSPSPSGETLIQSEISASTSVALTRELGPGVVEGPIRVPEGGSLTGVGPAATIVHVSGSSEAGVIVGARGFVSNLTVSGGRAGILVEGNAQLRNVVVTDSDNGILVRPASPVRVDLALINVTVSRNRADALNLATPSSAAVLIKNSVFSNNAGHGARCVAGQIRISYSNVFENAGGMAQGCSVSAGATGSLPGLSLTEEQAARAMGELGLLSLNPIFTDPDAFNFKLAPGSPLIDAGDPDDEFLMEPEPNGGRINQGAFGGTPEAEPTSNEQRAASNGGGGCGCAHIGGHLPLDVGGTVPVLILAGFFFLRLRRARRLVTVQHPPSSPSPSRGEGMERGTGSPLFPSPSTGEGAGGGEGLRWFSFVFLLLAVHGLLLARASGARADQFEILFNEILADPTGNDATHERIELKNTGAFGQALDGMCLCTASACGSSAWCFPPGTFVDAGGLLTVHVNEAGTKTTSDVFTGPWTDLGNSKDTLSLFLDNSDFTLDDNLVDFLQWGDGGQAREDVADSAAIWTVGQFIPAFAEGHSMEAQGPANSPSGWFDQWTPTLGAANLLNNRPVASVGEGYTVFEGMSVTLDGSKSFDPDGKTITYSWSQTAGPAAVLSSPTAKSATFTAPDIEGQPVLAFRLTVSDGALTSLPADVQVIVKDTGSLILAKTAASPGESNEKKGLRNLALLQFSLTAGPTEEIRVTSLTVQASGTGDDAKGIRAVRGVVDRNGNGSVEEGETEILSDRSLSSDNGAISWTGLDLRLPAGSTQTWIVACDLTNQPVFGQTFALTIPVDGILGKGMGSGKPFKVAALPLAGPAKRISDKTSLTVSLDPAKAAPLKVGPNAVGVPVLSLRLSAGSVEDVRVRSLTVSDRGSGDEVRSVREIRLIEDSNANGSADPGETLLGSPQRFARAEETENAVARFEPLALVVPVGAALPLLIVYDFTDALRHGEDFPAGIDAGSGIVAEGAVSNAAIEVMGLPLSGPKVTVENVGRLTASALMPAQDEIRLDFPDSVTAVGWKLDASKAEDLLVTTISVRGLSDLPDGVLSGVDLYEDTNADLKLSRSDSKVGTAILNLDEGEARFEALRVLVPAGQSRRLIASLRFGVDDAIAGGFHRLLPGLLAGGGILIVLLITVRRGRAGRRLSLLAAGPVVLGVVMARCGGGVSEPSATIGSPPPEVSVVVHWDGPADLTAVGQSSQQIVPVDAQPIQGPVIRLKTS
ncbi:MAG: PQQ-binding-like beta-propeller repeat protein [Nitrospirae bacterium]|nr:PQQ-binding-like beta-propeller repeat protein [Nitrospirota bacterium]